MTGLAIVFLFSYLLGAVPAGWIVARISGKPDIREHGSGATGATNTWRLFGWRWGVPVMAFDFFKGFVPVYIIIKGVIDTGLSPETVAVTAGLGAVIGHVFPVYIGFRGGKGVATGAGFLSALFPPVIPVCLGVFLSVIAATRRVSPGSIAASISAPGAYILLSFYFNSEINILIAAVYFSLPFLVIYTHRENIRKLINGTEKKLF